jgi:hypothetical protein
LLATAQARDAADERGEASEVFDGGGFRIAIPMGKCVGEAEGEEAGSVVCHDAAGFLEVGRVTGGLAEALEEILAGLPFQETAPPPLGEVLLADGRARKEIAEDLLDFRKAVEPCDEDAARDVGFEPAVEFITDVMGKAGDFSSTGHGRVGLCSNNKCDEGGICQMV